MKRYDDAVGAMKDILARFAPSVPPPNAEDPILALPLTIVSLRRNLGDTEGATRELREGLEYYQSLLERPLDPELEAHVRARVIRTALELDLPGRALAQVDSLQILVRRHESLRSMLPEVAFAQGKIRASIDRDPSDGIGILERIATDFPGSPYASQGLFEAASQLEAKGRFAEAKDRYGALLQRYPEAPELAPRAMLRYAALQDRLGDWISAKNTLEALPVRYPQSLAAADAPIAVIQHYMRENRRTAAELYFSKALDTYRTLVERDSTGRFAPVFRVKMFQIHSARNDTVGMYAITEEMLRAEPRHPYTAQVLLEAARAATQRGNPGRAVAYYRRFLHDFPQSRLAAQVRRELKSVGG
jgi:outer membrane protein assembly factor BamD (BamD/ComL family)